MRRRLLLAALALLALPGADAAASGMTTHAFMADRGREFVTTPELRALLDRQRGPLLAGGAYPDGGYAASSYPGGNFGEVTHWERFVNAYAAALRANPACRPLRDPNGPCADRVAFLMGIAAHGVGDEMWDWMFEPQAADRGESPTHFLYTTGLPGAAELAEHPPGSLANTMEYAMDMIAIVEHLRAHEIPAYLPPVNDLLAAYRAVDRPDITADGILAGHTAAHAAIAAERAAAAADYARVRMSMPWTSEHMDDESGGVVDVAQAAAGYYEALWAKLGGTHPRPRITAVHPEPGERGVPWQWAGASASPGPRGGGAQHRIIAVLSNALPTDGGYRIPADGFVLVDDETGERVPLRDGFPRTGPYHHTDGTHSMLLMPAEDLKPCHWYRVVVTPAIRDHAGARLERPAVWRFQTRSATPETAVGGCLPGAQPTSGATLDLFSALAHHH